MITAKTYHLINVL